MEAAVLGIADDDLGERITAWIVVASDSDLTDDVLVAHVATLLAPHKRPRIINRVDALPRNAMGKIQKTQLRSPA